LFQVSTIVWDRCNTNPLFQPGRSPIRGIYSWQKTSPVTSLDRGIAVIHSNKLEELGDVVEYCYGNIHWHRWKMRCSWCKVMAWGNGWSKVWRKIRLGYCCTIKVQCHRVYLECLSCSIGSADPQRTTAGKISLTWRLYRLLPALITQPGFETLAKFSGWR